ncbi:hypothetical protein OG453_05245 [Streptomyces sp. NBC_01381]|uniref:hypothetical protein n=1 Tax=Streptomyces sp. NBC_01381 TaxID=2903845 RepID=UPI002255502E|nr:hypothetical protein [Streptomyces sp. NBC_01381]MCX4666070.1 hypothetical protein [Streptomyces sp. NBC_01381]
MRDGVALDTGALWWLKARRAGVLCAALVAFALLVLAFQGGAAVPVLSLPASASVSVPLMLFTPVPVVAALAWCLDSRLTEAEDVAVRPVWAHDSALVLAAMATAAGTGLAVSQLAGSGAAGASGTGRDAAFLAGLVLCLRPLAGQAAVMAAPSWLALVVFFGFSPSRDPYPWTVVGQPAGSPSSLVAAALAIAVGLAVLIRTSRNAA